MNELVRKPIKSRVSQSKLMAFHLSEFEKWKANYPNTPLTILSMGFNKWFDDKCLKENKKGERFWEI